MKLVTLLLLMCGLVLGVAPDCQQTIHFTNRAGDVGQGVQYLINTIPASAPIFNNREAGCNAWTLNYSSEGFASLSIVLQDAPTVVTSSVFAPGSWVTFAGTTLAGSNPATNTSGGQFVGTGYYPWIQVNLTAISGTGSIDVILQGYKSSTDISDSVPIPAGTAIIGKVGIDQTTPGTTNGVQLTAGTALTGEIVQAANATTTDSVLTSYTTSAASTNATLIKNAAGNVYGISLTNTTATIYYLRMYNLASAPTCSSATGFIETIPALATASGAYTRVGSVGQGYTTGIGFCLTGGGSSTDNTNAATGVYVTVNYK